MKGKLVFNLLGMSLALLLLAGCAKPPQVEMDAAKASLEQAKAVQADLYLPGEYNAVQDSLNAALAVVEEQNAKFALFRNYKEATRMLTNTSALAGQLQQNAIARKEQVKLEVQTAYGELEAMMMKNKEMLAKAPKGKEGKAAIEAINNDLMTIEAGMPDVMNLFNTGEFLKAKDKVEALKQSATAINNELIEVLTKAGIKLPE